VDLDLIGLADLQGIVTPRLAREAVVRSLQALAEGRTVLPNALSLEVEQGDVHVKGAYLDGSAYLGFKVASGFPGNVNLGLAINDGFSVALNATTGRPEALLLDNGWLTQMRTGAAGALAADLLARPDASRVALIGAGEQAAFQLAALREVREIREVYVWSRTAHHAQRFAAAYNDDVLRVTAVNTVESAVSSADIVVTVTASHQPLLEAAWLRPGTHVTAVGSDTVGKRELASSVLSRADLLAADRLEVCQEVGELQYLAETRNPSPVVEFADLVTGRVQGRSDARQLTVIDQCGLGIYDASLIDLVMTTIRSNR
jgi:ornithine cyclodeaminase